MGGVILCITIVALVIILCCKWKKKRQKKYDITKDYQITHSENRVNKNSSAKQNDKFKKLVDLHC